MQEKRYMIVTPAQFSLGWHVFGGFRDGRVVTHHFPMRKVGENPEGNFVVIDQQVPADGEAE